MDSPWSVSDGSPCLSRLDFRAFHLQPPYCHQHSPRFTTLPVFITVRAAAPTSGRIAGRPFGRQGTWCAVRGSRLASALPDRLGRIEFTYAVTDYSFTSGCCSTLSHDSAVTTFGYRPVTITWTGLSPAYPNAFTGALATLARPWGPAGGLPLRQSGIALRLYAAVRFRGIEALWSAPSKLTKLRTA